MTDRTLFRIGLSVLGFLSVAYLLQLYSPLRLNTDAIVYLNMAASAVDGAGFAYKSELGIPSGYAALIAGLDLAGLGSAWAFTALNLLFLIIGLGVAIRLWRHTFQLTARTTLVLACLALLSFVFVRQVSIPTSEFSFFGLAMICLWLLTWAEQRQDARRWYALGLAVLLAAVAIKIRTIGIAFLPAILWASLPLSYRTRPVLETLLKTRVRTRLVVGILLLLLLALVLVIINQSPYFERLVARYQSTGIATRLMTIANGKLIEWGQLVINLPRSQAPASLRILFPLIGLMGLVTVGIGMWRRRTERSGLEIFMIVYVIILFLWPSSSVNPRFWLPVLPLIMGWATLVLQTRTPGFRKYLVLLYIAWLSLTGCAALAYTSWLTFSGNAFPDRYGDGTLRATYRSAFDGSPKNEEVDEEAFEMLIRYEPRTHPQWE